MSSLTTQNNLAETVRSTRKLAGLTQAELAQRAGVGKTLVFEVEKGSMKVSLENLLKILRVLNIQLTLTAPVPLKDEA